MANLAIEGHSTQGSEVIARLKMLGGMNTFNLNGSETNCYYYIDNNNRIYHCLGIDPRNYIYYTFEEFLEKFPYKVGDKVTFGDIDNIVWEIESLQWEDNEIKYIIRDNNKLKLCDIKAEHLQPYKEETMEVSEEFYNKYCANCGSQRCTAEGEWLEGCEHYKEETMEKKYNVEEYLEVWEETEKGLEVVVNNNFELKEDNGKFYIIKKQLQYPKTYEECFNICFGNKHHIVQVVGLDDLGDNKELFESFIKLKICRDAYWKIAGEEMGLGKDWDSRYRCGEWGYWIGYRYSVIKNKIDLQDSRIKVNHILVFPTEEMRDAFYENFKDLIEQCKELL